MRNTLLGVGIITLLLSVGCASAAEVALLEQGTRVIAHRGGTGPDGTVAGCLRSLDLGIEFLELDVRVTADGEAIILHDATVDRTTDGRGAVSGMTLAQVKRLDAGVKFQKSYAGERVPTVAEVLRAVGKRGIVLLELKAPEAAEPVIEAIRSERAFARAVVRNADLKLLGKIRNIEPKVLTGAMNSIPEVSELEAYLKKLNDLGVSTFTPRRNDRATRSIVRRFQAARIAFWGTNVNDQAVMRRLIEAGVDGIITDRPEKLLSMLR